MADSTQGAVPDAGSEAGDATVESGIAGNVANLAGYNYCSESFGAERGGSEAVPPSEATAESVDLQVCMLFYVVCTGGTNEGAGIIVDCCARELACRTNRIAVDFSVGAWIQVRPRFSFISLMTLYHILHAYRDLASL